MGRSCSTLRAALGDTSLSDPEIVGRKGYMVSKSHRRTLATVAITIEQFCGVGNFYGKGQREKVRRGYIYAETCIVNP